MIRPGIGFFARVGHFAGVAYPKPRLRMVNGQWSCAWHVMHHHGYGRTPLEAFVSWGDAMANNERGQFVVVSKP